MAKKAEPKCKDFFSWLSDSQGFELYWRKYGDVRACPHCGELMPKSDTMTDYVFGFGPMFVEVKDPRKDGSFDFKRGITPLQRNVIMKKWKALIFIELGNGRRNNGGKMAYIMSWPRWLMYEQEWEKKGWSSIKLDATTRREGVRGELTQYQLEWRDGTWTAPPQHPIWKYLSKTFVLKSI